MYTHVRVGKDACERVWVGGYEHACVRVLVKGSPRVCEVCETRLTRHTVVFCPG